MSNIDPEVLAAMRKIIARFKETRDGFCCLETECEGMVRFFKKKEESRPMSAEWEKSFHDVAQQILFVKLHVESEHAVVIQQAA